jgi:hypothetical protein
LHLLKAAFDMSKADYVDGFLEGHETTGTRTLYRFGVVSFVILSLFCGIINIAMQGHVGSRSSDALVSAAILGLLGYTLQQIKWYRQDNEDPKHRRATIVLILLVVLLDISACIAFHNVLACEPPVPVPETPVPTTMGPTPAPTPAPTNVTELMEAWLASKS